jgi:hypothetical protein
MGPIPTGVMGMSSSSSRMSASTPISPVLSSSSSKERDEDHESSSKSSEPHDDSPFEFIIDTLIRSSSSSSVERTWNPTPVIPAHRAKPSSSQSSDDDKPVELGCYTTRGHWTMNRTECALPAQQADLLGILDKGEQLPEEEFLQEASELFGGAAGALEDTKVREVRDLIALTMQRIDETLSQPGSPLSVEAALEMRNWLEEQHQTLTPTNAGSVADEVPRRIRFMESRPLFARIDAVKDAVWNAFHVFNEEGVALPLEDLFAYQNAVTAVDDPSCRYEGSACLAIKTFIDTVQLVHASMTDAAIVQGKPQLLDLLE